MRAGWTGVEFYPGRPSSTSPVLAFAEKICGFRARHARDLDRRHFEDVPRRASLQPDAVDGQERLVHEDTGSLEGKIARGRGPDLTVAPDRRKFPLVDTAGGRNERYDRGTVSVETIRA